MKNTKLLRKLLDRHHSWRKIKDHDFVILNVIRNLVTVFVEKSDSDQITE